MLSFALDSDVTCPDDMTSEVLSILDVLREAKAILEGGGTVAEFDEDISEKVRQLDFEHLSAWLSQSDVDPLLTILYVE